MRYYEKPKDNGQFFSNLLNWSLGPVGAPFTAMFIVDAVWKQADRISKMSLAEVQKAFGSHPLVNAYQWHETAKQLKKAFDEFYGR